MVWWFWVCAALIGGCSPHSSLEFRKEGEEVCQELMEELKEIETLEQLLVSEGHLKKKFEALVALMIDASRFQDKHLESEESPSEELAVSFALKEELQRVYLIEGGREVIERAEQEALVKLDAYERSRLKQREKLQH